jgi:putative oxidoreductase
MSTLRTLVYTSLRVIASFLLMQHGAQKLFGVLGGFGGTPGAKAALGTLFGTAGTIEFFLGALVLIGLCSRVSAFLISGEMAVAYFRSHAPHGFWPMLNHGELPVIFCFVFLFFAVYGGGPWSLDALLSRNGAARRDTHLVTHT